MMKNINLSDMETCYKVFKREVIQGIPILENRFGFELKITAKVARMNLRIEVVSLSTPKSGTTSTLSGHRRYGFPC